jgi:hypothetical protein
MKFFSETGSAGLKNYRRLFNAIMEKWPIDKIFYQIHKGFEKVRIYTKPVLDCRTLLRDPMLKPRLTRIVPRP